jgi:hypothetical protein
MHNQKRREFFRNVAWIVPALAVMPSSVFSKNVRNGLRTGIIGTGNWGRQYLSAALTLNDLTITAICDSDSASLKEGLQLFKGSDRPLVFDSWQDLLASNQVDVVIIATPAHTHYAIAKAAMVAGKHVACGPVMGETVEEHKDIVRISKQTGRHYFTLDEQSYRPDLQAIAGVDFGTLEKVYAGAPYDVLPPQDDTYPLYPSLFLHRLLGKDNRFETITTVTKQIDYVVRKVNPKTGNEKLIVDNGAIPFICLTTTQGQQMYLQVEKGYSTGTRIYGENVAWIDFIKSRKVAGGNWEHHPLVTKPGISPVAIALNELVNIVKNPKDHSSVCIAATNSLIALLARQSMGLHGKVSTIPDYTVI